MRDELCRQLVARSASDRMIFLTADLGFMALEPLQSAMGERFINCGIAEQNMITVAAALSYEGLETWTYTIAPFCYARAFEQIRNDVCIHNLPVKLLANGGGYGYGVMGPTHHALEDYGTLLTLPNIKVFVPAFTEDVTDAVRSAGDFAGPAYVRLGRGEKPADVSIPAYSPWRLLLDGDAGVLVVAGPLVGPIWAALDNMAPAERPALWVVAELPIEKNPPPQQLIAALAPTGRLTVVEEHVAQGGVGQQMSLWALQVGIGIGRFQHFHARGYPSGTYGSQAFLRLQSGLDPATISNAVRVLAR